MDLTAFIVPCKPHSLSEQSHMSVKLIIKKPGAEEVDIRRFSVDEDVCASYDYLVAKIRATVPSASQSAIRLFWKDNEGELISFSSDDELMEALGHVDDGVLRLYVELDGTPTASQFRHSEPQHCFTAFSSLLAGLTGGLHSSACSASSEPDVADGGCGRESAQKQEETAGRQGEQDFRQLIVDTANAFLEPLELKVVDRRRQPSDEHAAEAGARMTSSRGDRREDADDKRQEAATADSATDTATVTGRVDEILSRLGFDGEARSFLTSLIIHHADQLAQVLPASTSATG